MQFGTKFTGEKKVSAGGSGKWIKGLKEGDTRVRFLKPTSEWVEYWEHYNPAGTAFPCTGDKNSCPGCTSDNERMSKASRKVAAPAVVGQYVDVYKLTGRLAEKLKTKETRDGFDITERDLILTRIGTGLDTDYDYEGLQHNPIDLSAYEVPSIEAMLQEAFNDNWPDFLADQVLADKPAGVAQPQSQPEQLPPPSEPVAQSASAGQQESSSNAETGAETEVSIEDLRKMTPDQLRDLCKASGADVPEDLTTQAAIIGWMEKTFA